jgi:hypothetical protein
MDPLWAKEASNSQKMIKSRAASLQGEAEFQPAGSEEASFNGRKLFL